MNEFDEHEDNEKKNNFFQLASELIREGVVDIKDVYGLTDKMIAESVKRHRESDDYTPKEYVGLAFATTAYEYILDHGGSKEDAFEYAMEVHDKTEEWMRAVKNRKYYYAREVVNKHDNHPIQKAMLREDIMDRNALTTAGTINQQIGKLSKKRKLYDILNDLRNQVDEHERKIDLLTAKDVAKETYIKELREYTGLKDEDPKTMASQMKAMGCTQKTIAEVVGRTERTIRRWWSEL